GTPRRGSARGSPPCSPGPRAAGRAPPPGACGRACAAARGRRSSPAAASACWHPAPRGARADRPPARARWRPGPRPDGGRSADPRRRAPPSGRRAAPARGSRRASRPRRRAPRAPRARARSGRARRLPGPRWRRRAHPPARRARAAARPPTAPARAARRARWSPRPRGTRPARARASGPRPPGSRAGRASWRARCSTERPGTCKQSTDPIREDALVNLEYSAEYEEFRTQVRRFLAEHWSAGDAARQPDPDGVAAFAGAVPTDERATAFRLKAIERGYLYRHVPRRYGGGEQPPDPLRATIIAEEFRRARAPHEMMGQG